MRIGFGLPVGGPAAGPDGIAQVAKRAEELGYDSVWIWERLLFPVDPQVPYVASPDGSYPDAFKRVLDPVQTLTYAAAVTSRVALGSSVLDLSYYNPVMLAREFTTLDVLSNGRLRAGLGIGWCKDEFDTVGVPMKRLGRRADEFVTLLKAIWTTDPVEFKGEFYQLPKSIIQPKPVQKPHPPLYLAAYSPGGLQRIAKMANGWNPVGVPLDGMKQMMDGIRGMAQEAGRDPSELELVVRANTHFTDGPAGEGRPIFYGSRDEIKADIEATRELGASEIIFDPSFEPAGDSLDGFLRRAEEIRELV